MIDLYDIVAPRPEQGECAKGLERGGAQNCQRSFESSDSTNTSGLSYASYVLKLSDGEAKRVVEEFVENVVVVPNYDWVDAHVREVSSKYRTTSMLQSLAANVDILEEDVSDDIISHKKYIMASAHPEGNKNYLMDLWLKRQAWAVKKKKDRAGAEVVIFIRKDKVFISLNRLKDDAFLSASPEELHDSFIELCPQMLILNKRMCMDLKRNKGIFEFEKVKAYLVELGALLEVALKANNFISMKNNELDVELSLAKVEFKYWRQQCLASEQQEREAAAQHEKKALSRA
ncbi:hypothetical protein VNO80_09848 [Phaseolus coccineus]|uniref:Uncharacterized protein n=1 Tax=Phaseolus coccineus TaxID=3886 RepID=A0AAN9N6Y7_PHACN